MTDSEPKTLTSHLEHLAVDADDVVAMLTRHHEAGGDLHPEALPKAERLKTSLNEIIHALTHNEHLAMDADDVWGVLNREHHERPPTSG